MARGWIKKSQGTKQKYEDIEKYFECPKCKGTINNFAWHCRHCGFSATIYNVLDEGVKITYSNYIDKEETEKIRKKLIRINPWSGDKWTEKKAS